MGLSEAEASQLLSARGPARKLASSRRFFALSAPTAGVLLTAAVAGLLAIGVLALAGFSLTTGRGELPGGEG